MYTVPECSEYRVLSPSHIIRDGHILYLRGPVECDFVGPNGPRILNYSEGDSVEVHLATCTCAACKEEDDVTISSAPSKTS